MPSRAEAFFDQLRTTPDQSAAVRKLVTDKTPETEILEFKGGRIDEKGTKTYWSQALSGFANSGGGILIFGIKTSDITPPEGGRRINTATDVDLVPNPQQLIQLLRDIHLSATEDVVQAVQYLPINEAGGNGFVVCFVPEGKHKPYRAMLDPTKNYYQRVSDNFVLISHSFLRALFYPRFHPRLHAKVRIITIDPDLVQLHISLLNDGSATATDMVVRLTFSKKFKHTLGPGAGFVVPFVVGDREETKDLRIGTTQPLHPTDEREVCGIAIYNRLENDYLGTKITLLVHMANQEPFAFEHVFHLEDFAPPKDKIIALDPIDPLAEEPATYEPPEWSLNSNAFK